MILATEMTRHFEHLAKFVSVFGGEEPREVGDQVTPLSGREFNPFSSR